MNTPFAEYTRYDALGLAELVRKREVSPAELVETAIAHIEAINPRLNAVIHTMYDYARKAAAGPLPPGPFAGVPFLLKDLVALIAGVPISAGSRAIHGLVPDFDSTMIERYRAAGLVFVGKTNTPELGVAVVTEPELFGPTHNPWDLTRSPGGSSGGSGAAVAARLVPVASGSDGGGSLRIPASACGVFALKPSRGRTPCGPDRGDLWNGLAIEHVISRSVRDSAAMLDVTAGPDPGAPYHAPPWSRPFLDEVGADPGRLRIAFTTRSLLGSHVDRECAEGVEETARLLADLGHDVEEATPVVDREPFTAAFLSVVSVQVAAELDEIAALRGRPNSGMVEPITRAMELYGRTVTAVELERMMRTLHRATRKIGAFFQGYDVLLTPTLAQPPLPTGGLRPTPAEHALLRTMSVLRAGSLMKRFGLIEKMAPKFFDYAGFTPVFNVTGQPAMSVPLVWSKDGLPIGMQLAGRYGDEATLLRLAAQLETARPWADRRPPVCAA
jgi:amidase